MKIFGMAGWSGSGKTTLLKNLLPELVRRGISVSTIKHAHHNFDVDRPGKDSYIHREAGATEVLVGSANRWALMHEMRGAPEPTLDELISHMSPVDLLIIEGFKFDDHDKIEIRRLDVDKPPLAESDEHIIAIASDVALDGFEIPILDLNDIPKIADFILSHVGLTGKK